MKWFSHVLAWVLLVALIALAPTLQAALPNTSEGRAADVYKQWAGVLRVWVCMGWQPGNGSITPWLNEVAARFEKAYPGVYVQVTPVSMEQLANFKGGELNPPDAVVFSPGLIRSAEGLAAIEGEMPVVASLARVGAADGGVYAAPIAMGGYAWAVNTQLLDGLPLWDRELPAPTRKDEPAYVMQAPRDGEHVSWSGALLALCQAAEVGEQKAAERKLVGEGVDLGLGPEDAAKAEPAATEAPVQAMTAFTRPTRLPANFRQDNTVMGDFAARRAAAVPVTQVEIKRLENLADTGRAPDYEILAGAGTFTDQVALFGIVDGGKAAQARLCRALLGMLWSEQAQAWLSGVRALRVTEGPALYSSNRGMAALESAYAGRDIEAPGAFDSGYIERKQLALDQTLG